MLQRLKLKGDLKFGAYKTISCDVQLEIDLHEEDEWADPDPNYNPANYIDGVRVGGEFSFDTSPITDKHPIKANAVGELVLRDGDESTKVNILLVERTGVVDIVPKRVKRYFWSFFAVGKPVWDALGIFPKDYRGVNMNKIFACTNFRGYWPVGVASVIVAADKREAKTLLDQKLRDSGIHVEDCEYTITEISILDKGAVILNDGKWQ